MVALNLKCICFLAIAADFAQSLDIYQSKLVVFPFLQIFGKLFTSIHLGCNIIDHQNTYTLTDQSVCSCQKILWHAPAWRVRIFCQEPLLAKHLMKGWCQCKQSPLLGVGVFGVFLSPSDNEPWSVFQILLYIRGVDGHTHRWSDGWCMPCRTLLSWGFHLPAALWWRILSRLYTTS